MLCVSAFLKIKFNESSIRHVTQKTRSYRLKKIQQFYLSRQKICDRFYFESFNALYLSVDELFTFELFHIVSRYQFKITFQINKNVIVMH